MDPTTTTTETTTTAGPGNAAFEVEPAILIGAAGTIDAEADAITDGAARLQARLAALGAPWGTDAVGQRFGTGYEPVATTVLTNIAALATGLVRIGAALRAVATNYEEVERALTPDVPSPRPPVTGGPPPLVDRPPVTGGPLPPTPAPPDAPPMSDPLPSTQAPSPADTECFPERGGGRRDDLQYAEMAR